MVSVLLLEALRALLRYKLRSGLTTLGITIGVAAVVLAIAIGSSGAERIQAELAKLGENLVWVEAGSRTVSGVRSGTKGATTLTVDDAEAILREVPLIAKVSPQVDGNVQVVGSTANWMTRFRGGSADYASIRRNVVALGMNFSADDVEQTARKVVLGQTVREKLFGDANPLGETVRMLGQPYEVIGVLAPKGQSPDGRDQDDWVLLPYTTAMRRLRAAKLDYLDDIFCSAVAPEQVAPAID
ncbi:MAG: ABC transporter permease [Myxococcaceae bacterium]